MINREEELARAAAGEDEKVDPWGGRKSRSQKKREAHGLTDLGARLTELNSHELSVLPMDDELRAAVIECRRLTKNARSRQLRLIGKLLRVRDVQELTDKVEGATEVRRAEHAVEQSNEHWRRRLLEEGDFALTEFRGNYPEVDVAELRGLVRQYTKLKTGARAIRASREVLRMVRAVRAAAAEVPAEGVPAAEVSAADVHAAHATAEASSAREDAGAADEAATNDAAAKSESTSTEVAVERETEESP